DAEGHQEERRMPPVEPEDAQQEDQDAAVNQGAPAIDGNPTGARGVLTAVLHRGAQKDQEQPSHLELREARQAAPKDPAGDDRHDGDIDQHCSLPLRRPRQAAWRVNSIFLGSTSSIKTSTTWGSN